MQTVTNPAEYEGLYRQWAGRKIALVPTMGALHEGHLALIRMARRFADKVVVSIFVNPLQFGPQEDLSDYPRPKEADLASCRDAGVDAVFYPSVEVMYPNGTDCATQVIPPESLTDRYCGAFRPGHFVGVATVVLKLLALIRPHIAIFGEKDAQQLAVIRAMVKDLQVQVEIMAHPLVREMDGLALSSRNRYLQTEAERKAALCLYQMLSQVQRLVQEAPQPLLTSEILAQVSNQVLSEQDPSVPIRLQYFEAVEDSTFRPATSLNPGVRLLIAAYVGDVRLIDNWLIQ